MAVALLAGADHRYRMQDARSLADWGDHRGSPLAEMSRLYQPEDVIRDVVMAAVEAAYDTGDMQSYELPANGGVGRTSVLRVDGVLLSRWVWITEPPQPAIDLVVRMGLMAEHLDHLAWALREGLPMPRVPAALRGAPGSRPASGASRPPAS